MNKQEFLSQMRNALSALPHNDIEEQLTFYSEMIDDQTDEGISEEDAIAQIGSVEKIVAQIISETTSSFVTDPIKPKRSFSAWEILLIVIGSPVWLSLLIAVLAIILSIYIALWSVIISLWAVFGSAVGAAVCGIVAGTVIALTRNVLPGIAMIGAGLTCLGISIFLFFGCRAATKGILLLTNKIANSIKNLFVKRGPQNA